MKFGAMLLVVAVLSHFLGIITVVQAQPKCGSTVRTCSIEKICFAIDESGSIVGNQFPEEKTFVTGIADEVAKQNSGVSVEYSAAVFNVVSRIGAAATTDRKQFNSIIASLTQRGGGTFIGSGLSQCDKLLGSGGNRIIVAITDGRDAGSSPTQRTASDLKNKGVGIISVGIGPSVNAAFLRGIASGPNFYVSASFGSLSSSIMQATMTTCQVSVTSPCPTPSPTPSATPSVTPSPTPCPVDNVCFAIDNSGSISAAEFKMEKDFAKAAAKEIAIRSPMALYSAHTFNVRAKTVRSMTMKLVSDFLPAIDALMGTFGYTNMKAGLEACFNDLHPKSGTKMLVLITDGRDNGHPRAIDVAPTIKKNGIAILTVGVGNDVAKDYLKMLASDPSYFLQAPSFAMLSAQVNRLAGDLCVAAAHSPMPPPTDPCAKTYKRCLLRFHGIPSGTPQFKIKTPAHWGFLLGSKFTPEVIKLLDGKNPGILKTRLLGLSIVEKTGKEVPLKGNPFAASSWFWQYSIVTNKYRKQIYKDIQKKCVKAVFRIRGVANSPSFCVAFKFTLH